MTRLIGTAPNQVPVNGMLGNLAFLNRESLPKFPPVGGIAHLMTDTDTVSIDGMLFLKSGLAVRVADVPAWPAWATQPSAAFNTVTAGFSGSVTGLATNGPGGVWIGSAGPAGLLRRSADHGSTWATITSTQFSTAYIKAAEYGNGVFLIAGDSGKISRSTDGGVTWTAVTSGFSSSTSVRALATDGAGVWLAGNDSGDIRRSTDNGVTWSAVTSGFTAGLAIFSIGYGNGAWVAGQYSVGMRRSTDGGITWSPIASGQITSNSIKSDGAGVWIVVGNAGTVKRSTDNGVTWSSVTTGQTDSLPALCTDCAGTWIATVTNSGRLIKSTDNGVTWSVVATTSAVEAIATYAGLVTIAIGNITAVRSRYAIGIETYTPYQYLRIA